MMEKKEFEQIEAIDVPHESATDALAASHEHVRRSALERSLLRKADMVMIPIVSILYLVTYLDRNSIGNAAVMGLQQDLNMSADQYYNCLMVFYIGYGISMLPANLTSRKFKPNRSLGVAVTFFGICLCGMAEAKNGGTIIALRILLGFGQGFVQMAVIYFSLWYRRDELSTRVSIFYACATISGAFSGLISYGVQRDLGSPTGRKPWSWLFLIEGLLAVGWGIIIFAFLPRYPDDLSHRGKRHWLFTAEEIELAHRRYEASNMEGEKFKWAELGAILTDIKTWFFAFIEAAAILGVSVVGLFLPTFIRSFGYSPVRTQLFTVIPYAFAFVTVITIGYLSDRLNSKGPFLFAACCTGAIGYLLLIVVSSTVARIVATCLITSSCYPIAILCPAWMAINIPSFTKRGGTWAFSELIGTAFAIMGSRIYNRPPRFIGGHSTVLALYLFGAVNVAALYLWMRLQNRKKESELEDYARRGEVHPHIAEQKTLGDLQDEHISFRYIL